MPFQIGHTINLGRCFSEEHKRKISESHKGHKYGMFGKKHSEDTIIKMKNSYNSGWFQNSARPSKKTEFKKTQAPWNKDRKTGELSKKHREKIADSHRGNKAWNWKGENTLSKRLRGRAGWKAWRKEVYLRDFFTCQNPNCKYCSNKPGVKLHPHHIKPLALHPELAFNVDNGITYCAEFHIKEGLHLGIQNGNERGINK